MKKRCLITVLIALFLIALSGSAFAWSPKLEGKPDQFALGASNGYYIWHDDNGFHVWTTTRGKEHVFSGTIKTDGDIYRIRGNRLEEGDSFKEYSDNHEKKWFEVSDNRGRKHYAVAGREVDCDNDKIRFKFDTAGGSDGIDFRIKNASYVEFELFVDGHRINTKQIFIGDDGWHPHRNTFRIYQ